MSGYRLGALAVLISFFATITATVLLPAILFNPKPSGSGNTYEKMAGVDPARGRQIYIREGCVYCHSQFTRLQDREMGPLVMAGDYVEETPNQLGTARTGPDLSNEGGKHPPGWQTAHLINPRALKPGSIMPSFSFLSERDLKDLVAYIERLGQHRQKDNLFEAPEEYRPILERRLVDTDADSIANIGHGLFVQDCSSCHGQFGRGNGPASVSMATKPANFTRPYYKNYSDIFWFYRITEGIPGTRMPHWGEALTETQRWYLVAYLKRFPQDNEHVANKRSDIDGFAAEMGHVHHSWNPNQEQSGSMQNVDDQ